MSDFDKTTFATLLNNAKGDRSINQYALDIGVSAAHISRLLRSLVNSPPSPDTISKFAEKAHGGVTYNDLMLAAGHISEYSEKSSSENKVIKAKEIERKFFQAIMADLYAKDFEWSMNKTIDGLADIVLEINNWEYSKWYIEIKAFVTNTTIFNVYGQMSLIEFSPDIKASIAVGSESEFNLFINRPPKSLKANLYIMLVDLDAGRIVKEKKLCQY